MFELKGKYLTSRYYARKMPSVSLYVYEMSHVKDSSFFYKTLPFPTRLIDLQSDFQDSYSKKLQYYFRQAEKIDFEITRPEWIPDLKEMYQPIMESKNLNPLPGEALKIKSNFYYSVIYHPQMGRLAAHLNVGDWQERTVYAFINASAFRSYNKKEDQRLCSISNKYLFHKDMLHFRSLGYHYYDMVGISEPMNQMKMEFGGEIVMTYTHLPWPIYLLKNLKKLLRT